MEWRHSGSIRPIIPSAKIQWKSSRLHFLGSRRHPPHWLSSKGPNYQRGVLLISAGATEGHFERKTPRKVHQGGLVFAWHCPGSPGNCNPEETGLPGLPISWPPTLFSGYGPVELPPVPWTEKRIERSPFFVRRVGHCCRGDLVGRTTFRIFLSGLQKLEQRAKKCTEPRGDYVEQIPSLVAVVWLLPGQAKDLSASPRILPHCMSTEQLVYGAGLHILLHCMFTEQLVYDRGLRTSCVLELLIALDCGRVG